jgi:hypothetical protein
VEGAEHVVPHQHARRGDVEDLRGGVVLSEIDLALFETLVGISEAVRRHPDLLQTARIVPANDLGSDDGRLVVGHQPLHHVLHGFPGEGGIVVNEEEEVGVGPHSSQGPIDRAPEAERPGGAQVSPPPSSEMALGDPADRRTFRTMTGGSVVYHQDVQDRIGLVGEPD